MRSSKLFAIRLIVRSSLLLLLSFTYHRKWHVLCFGTKPHDAQSLANIHLNRTSASGDRHCHMRWYLQCFTRVFSMHWLFYFKCFLPFKVFIFFSFHTILSLSISTIFFSSHSFQVTRTIFSIMSHFKVH